MRRCAVSDRASNSLWLLDVRRLDETVGQIGDGGAEGGADLGVGASSAILDQVEAGVAIRMAVLWMMAAEEPLPTSDR